MVENCASLVIGVLALATCVGNQNGSRFTQICPLWKK